MRIQTVSTTVQTNATFEDKVKMTIDEESLPHIISVLTNQYSDVPAAIVREISSNGYDSHVLAGQSKPVEITGPTYLSANLIVKDHGVGMSRQDLKTIYSKYGASTKRDTNTQIGGFGLGAKTPLALIPSFTIIAIKDGKRNTVIVSKNEEGTADLNFLPEQDTADGSGVTITIPVPDAREFQRVLNSDIFLGWPARSVKVNGNFPASIHDDATYRKLGEAGWYNQAQTVGGRYGAQTIKAFVGPVAYQIEHKVVTEVLAGMNLKPSNIFLNRVVLNLPNGSVALTPSREQLIYTAATKASIKRVLLNAVTEANRWASETVDAKKTRIGAWVAAKELVKAGVINGIVKYKGEGFATANEGVMKAGFFINGSHNRDKFGSSEVARNYNENLQTHSITARHENDSDKVAYVEDRKFILVTGADKRKNGSFITSTAVAPYAAQFQEDFYTYSRTRKTMQVLTTTLTEAEVDPWLVALAYKKVTAEEIRAYAQRNQLPKQAKVAGVRTEMQVSISTTSTATAGRKYGTKQVETSKLPSDGKYLLVQASGVDGVGPDTLENRFYCYFRKAVGSNTDFHMTDLLVQHVIGKGYTVVVLPATADREKVTEALVNTHEIVDVLTTTLAYDLTEVEKDYLAYQAKHSHWNAVNAANIWPADADLAEIENTDTREWLKLTYSGNTGTHKRGEILRNLAKIAQATERSATYFDGACEGVKASLATLLTHTKQSPTRKYALISNRGASSNRADVTEYINLFDGKHFA